MYAVNYLYEAHGQEQGGNTSSPESIPRITMSSIAFGRFFPADAPGYTITQLGRHDWLIIATIGERAMPIGMRDVLVRVCALAEN
jgi:hypothetical protein